MLLVDSNVILDVVEDDPRWADWSQAQLDAAAVNDLPIINPIIYAELSLAFERIEELEAMLANTDLRVQEIPREALFLAGRAFLQYRRRGGARTGVLPDFFIGAHAAVAGLPLLTRDTSRYATYFPGLTLITPKNQGQTPISGNSCLTPISDHADTAHQLHADRLRQPYAR